MDGEGFPSEVLMPKVADPRPAMQRCMPYQLPLRASQVRHLCRVGGDTIPSLHPAD